MKVLFISQYDALYGANLSMLNLIKDLRERYSVECEVICSGNDGLLENALSKEKVKCYNATYSTVWERNGVSENQLIWNAKKILNSIRVHYINMSTKKIIKLVKDINPDIIHTNTSVTNIGQIISKTLNIPHVWHLREYGDLDYNYHYALCKRDVASFFESAASLIAISDSIMRHYMDIAPKAKIRLIYNGIHKFEIKHKASSHIRFCCVGLLSEKKNQLEIIKAAIILREKGLDDFSVTLVGSGDIEYENKLKEVIEKNCLSDIVKLVGYHEDIMPFLEEADVGIMSSVNEAFGRTTVEYMLAEMPVIGTNSGGTPEIISHGKSGFLYEPFNIPELANYMEYFMRNRASIAIMGRNGREHALRNYSVQANTDAVYGVYKLCLKV